MRSRKVMRKSGGCRTCMVGGKKSKTYRRKQKLRHTKKSYRGGNQMHAAEKIWVCKGNIGCARNINIYK